MNHLPENPLLGKLEYLEVYSEYDAQPCFFSCQNETRQIYLALWVDETEDYNRWLYSRTIPHKLEWLKRGRVDIRSRFTQTAEQYVYDVKIGRNNICCVEVLPCSALTDDLLPVTGELLKYD
jgi:hypothetical protein